MICHKCREWCRRGAASCQRCGRHSSAVTEWDKKMKVVKTAAAFVALIFLCFLLVALGKIANRGVDKVLDGWGW